MAARKTSRKTGQQSSQAVIVFWLVFIVIIAGIFLAKKNTIQNNFNILKSRLSVPSEHEEEPLPVIVEVKPDETAVVDNAPARTPAVPQGNERPQNPVPEKPAQERQPAETRPAETRSVETKPADRQPSATQPQPVQTRDRYLYFTQIDKDGQILRSRVSRKIPVSDSPMQDALNVLLKGPGAEEINRGIINLIPQNTRLLSATVRGTTAYISFSEDFQFNTFGAEGYAAQLRQIVWTATEFPTVNDVQILIEGRRLDYLGEGIWIGSPLNRQSL